MTRRGVRWFSRSLLHMVIISVCFMWTLPSIGLLANSFRSRRDVVTTGWWTVFRTPFTLTVDNYVEVLTGQTQYGKKEPADHRRSILKDIITGQGMGRAFLNSLIISIPSTLIPILVASFAAYALAWMRFPGRDLLLIVVVALLVVPLQMTLIPILRLYYRLHLAGTFLGVWLAHTAYGLPYAIYLLRNFFKALPRGLFESASLDGASQFVVFYRIVVPLSIPSIASLAIFQFLWVWNDLLVALIYLGGTRDVAPLTMHISGMMSSLGENWHLLPAGAFISMVLPLIIFSTLQPYFVRGILAGSVKG
ncbi:MAG: carbohydrate ABC transporter permease [Thermodesulfobacteriota bacterium]